MNTVTKLKNHIQILKEAKRLDCRHSRRNFRLGVNDPSLS